MLSSVTSDTRPLDCCSEERRKGRSRKRDRAARVCVRVCLRVCLLEGTARNYNDASVLPRARIPHELSNAGLKEILQIDG